MYRQIPALCSLATRFASALLLALLSVYAFKAFPAHAGNGPTIDIPASNITPTMDGVCNPSEYSDATQVSVTVGGINTFPVYMKHTAENAYFCFGDASGLPLPNGGDSQVAIYIDPDNDGSSSEGEHFGIWMPYHPLGSPHAAYWGVVHAYNGPDPGGWQAVKYQTPGVWQVEFRISHQTMGGWKHTVGLALFYHWWRGPSDDFSWPEDGIWASPIRWGNGSIITADVDVGYSLTIPTMDGLCNPADYSDAATINFTTPDGDVTAYLEHSLTDLHVCLQNLTIPTTGLEDEPNAALYIDRSGTGGTTPGANDLLFTISYSGTVRANSGDGSGFTGPDPGGHVIARGQHDGVWDAEFQISGATITKWWSRNIGLTVVEQSINTLGDYSGWPTGYNSTIPNSWGVARLTQLGSHNYLPILFR